ncbi:hypothetical protein BDZ45DRAFT_76063 [Acephala macrosclerotiorum]|nr:hypothetical protein BDZ45DRAFT_76063 [Acephala macrosclerotiorum]
MMRIISRMFSSSQAQPSVKNEIGSDDPQNSRFETTNQCETERANNTGEGHAEERLDQEFLDVNTPDAEADIPNNTKEKKGKRKANGKAKRGKAAGNLTRKKAPRKSQVQEELLEGLCEEPEDMEVDAANTSIAVDMDGSLEAIPAVSGDKNGKPKSKVNETKPTTTKSKTARKSALTVDAADDENEGDYDTPHQPGRRSGSSLSNGGSAVEESAAHSKAPKATRSRKSNAKNGTKSKRKAAPLSDIVDNPAAEQDDVDEDEALFNSAKLERAQANAGATKKPRKSRTKKDSAAEITPEEPQKDAVSEDLAVLLKKIEKGKQKAKTPVRPILDELAAEDDDDSAAPLHQPLTPALVHLRNNSATLVDPDTEAQLQNNAWSMTLNRAALDRNMGDDVDSPPKRPSEKALGKRKASDVDPEPRKKQRKRKEKPTGTPPLTNFGFTTHSESPMEEQGRFEQHSRHSGEDFASIAARQIKESLEKDSSPSAGPQATSRFLQNERQPTPMFTPINKRTVPAKCQPVISLGSLTIPLNPEPRPVVRKSPEAPPMAPREDLDDSGSEFEPVEEPVVPKSNEKRKRRLPTGEPESSKKLIRRPLRKPASSKPPKDKAASKTSKAKSTSRPSNGTPTGRLSDEQIAEMAEHVESWRGQEGMAQFAFNEMVQKSMAGDSKRLVAYLCDEMSDIPRQKIVNTLRRRYHNYEARGAWTPDQDEELKSLHESYPGKWKQIGEIMNRFPEDCRDRWRNYLICGDNQRKDAWDKEEEERLKVVIAEILESVRELKQASADPREKSKDDESLIDWNIVSEKMGRTRSRLQCLSKWKILKERQDTTPNDPVANAPIAEAEWRLEAAQEDARSMSADKKLRLLYAIKESGAGREGKIPWVLIQKDDLNTKGERMALRVCFRNLREQVPDQEDMEFSEIVQYLIDAFEASAPNDPAGFLAPFGFERKKKTGRKSGERKKRVRDENGELSSTKRKKRRISPLQAGDLDALSVESESEREDNGERPSTRRLNITKAKKPILIQDLNSSKRKKKARERMRQHDQSQSQETNITDQHQGEECEDILATMQSLKNGKAKAKRVAKKPLVKPKKALQAYKSTERITASDDELEPVPEGEAPVIVNDSPELEQSRPQTEHRPQDDSEREEEPLPVPESSSTDLDQDQEDALPQPEIDMDLDPNHEEANEPIHASEFQVRYPNLTQDFEDFDENNAPVPSLFLPNGDGIHVGGIQANGAESDDEDGDDSSPPDLVDSDQEDYTLPALPRPQPSERVVAYERARHIRERAS